MFLWISELIESQYSEILRPLQNSNQAHEHPTADRAFELQCVNSAVSLKKGVVSLMIETRGKQLMRQWVKPGWIFNQKVH